MSAEKLHAPSVGWYAVAPCRSVPRQGRRALRVQVWQHDPVAIWRDAQGELHALRDACPHRQVPLSAGRLHDNELTCAYHGWRFNAAGDCVHVPAECQDRVLRGCVPTYPCVDSMGLVWLWMGPQPATRPPYTHPGMLAPGRCVVRLQRRVQGHVVDVVENFIDSAHTPFLHRGVIRGNRVDRGKRGNQGNHSATPRAVEVHSTPVSVTARHAPVHERVAISHWGSAKEPLVHHDTVHAPSVVEVVYRFGAQVPAAFMALIACTPRSAQECDIYVTLSVQAGRWALLLKPVLHLLARWVLRQDIRMLRLQQRNLASLTQRRDLFPPSDTLHRRVRQLMLGRAPDTARVEQFKLKV